MIDEVNTVTINQITQDNLRSTAFPLPPLNEQARIVAKIDELMARCDALENLRAARDAKRHGVHNAAVRQLLNVADTDRHIQAREFLAQHFGELYIVKDNVTELRKAILQLAVMGKLVPQDPNDSPASELLNQIEAEKRRLVKEGKLRETKNLIATTGELDGTTLPQGWTWTQLQNLVAIVTDGDHQPPPKADRGVPFLVIGNLNRMAIDFADCRFVRREYYDALDWSRKPKRRDVLYTVTGSYGIPIVVDGDEEFCVQRHVAIFKSAPSTPVEYLSWVLRSETSVNYATTIATGIAQKTVPLTGLRAMPIPLPPLGEQRRIVAKIDQLMSMCDTLEQQIDAARGTQSSMLSAMMAQYGGQRCA
jgi:type I restriction enzyme S subunit